MKRLSLAASLLAACAILAACGDGTAPKVSPVTIDSLLAEIGETQAFGTPGMVFTGPLAVGAMPSRSDACAYNSTTQRFVCPPISMGGLTTNRYYQLLDAAGTPQSAFNPATTDAFRTVADVEGSITVDLPALGTVAPAAVTVTMASHEDLTLSGLLTGVHTLNGTGSSTSTFSGEELPGLTTSWTITNLVLPKRGAGAKYPQSGTMTVAVEFNGGELSSHITMAFNGTSIMTMTMVTNGMTTVCTVNMAKPGSPPSCG
jgi:hypothetical protein